MASKKYTEEQFINAVKEGHSYAEVCRIIGITPKGGNLNTVKKKIQQLNLDMSHFTGARWNKGLKSGEHPSIKKKDISEITNEDLIKNKISCQYAKYRTTSKVLEVLEQACTIKNFSIEEFENGCR